MSDAYPAFITTSLEEIVARSKAPDKFTLICLGGRPGALRFFTLLEWTHFQPKTPANQDFDFTLLKWPHEDGGLVWIVVIMPLTIRPLLHAIAEETGMRLVNGVPMVIGSGPGPALFPIHHDRAFSIENNPESPLYLPGGDAFMREEEQRWMADFFKQKGLTWP